MTTDSVTSENKAWLFCRQCGEAELLRTAGPDLLERHHREETIIEFLGNHVHHTVTQLVPTAPEATYYSGPLWHPETVVWIEVTDGVRTYVLEGSRFSLSEPRRYRIRQGVYLRKVHLVHFDKDHARRAWSCWFNHLGRFPCPSELLERAHELVARIDPHSIAPDFDIVEEPDTAVAAWPAPEREALRRAGRTILPPLLHDSWDAFVSEQCQAHGAWALLIRKKAWLVESVNHLDAPL